MTYRNQTITMTPDGWYHVNIGGTVLNCDILSGLKDWINECSQRIK